MIWQFTDPVYVGCAVVGLRDAPATIYVPTVGYGLRWLIYITVVVAHVVTVGYPDATRTIPWDCPRWIVYSPWLFITDRGWLRNALPVTIPGCYVAIYVVTVDGSFPLIYGYIYGRSR